MRGRLICIQTDGAWSVAPITGPPSLEALRMIVEGSIEVIPYFDRYRGDRCIAFCNEQGKRLQLPLNPLAQAHWLRALGMTNANDHLVGNVAVVCGDDELLAAL